MTIGTEHFDPATERFKTEKANALLSREHRAPYTFPTAKA